MDEHDEPREQRGNAMRHVNDPIQMVQHQAWRECFDVIDWQVWSPVYDHVCPLQLRRVVENLQRFTKETVK